MGKRVAYRCTDCGKRWTGDDKTRYCDDCGGFLARIKYASQGVRRGRRTH